MSFEDFSILVKSLLNQRYNLTIFHVYRYGKIYSKAAKNCMAKGDYAKNEIERLQRMLQKVRLIDFFSYLKRAMCNRSQTAVF
jgi:hypothetical protein